MKKVFIFIIACVSCILINHSCKYDTKSYGHQLTKQKTDSIINQVDTNEIDSGDWTQGHELGAEELFGL